jgi:hypothetical protein
MEWTMILHRGGHPWDRALPESPVSQSANGGRMCEGGSLRRPEEGTW